MSDFNGGPEAPSSPFAASLQRGKWSEVEGVSSERYRVRLGGFFGPAWMANLCRGVAEHRLSIERAEATRLRSQTWSAELMLWRLEGATDPEAVPYVALAEVAHPPMSAPLSLDHYDLIQTHDHGGTLRLTIHAEDALGLLGALLAQFATLVLFPVEMQIDTKLGRANDTFWLASIGGAPPSAPARAALERLLEQGLRTR